MLENKTEYIGGKLNKQKSYEMRGKGDGTQEEMRREKVNKREIRDACWKIETEYSG